MERGTYYVGWEWDIGHRTMDMGHMTMDMGHGMWDVVHRTWDIAMKMDYISRNKTNIYFGSLLLTSYRINKFLILMSAYRDRLYLILPRMETNQASSL